MKNADKIGLLEVPIPDSVPEQPRVLFEVETYDGNIFRFFREGNPDFIKQLIG